MEVVDVARVIYRVVGETLYFDDALAAQTYAKEHPGTVIVREASSEQQESAPRVIEHTPQEIVTALNRDIIAQDEAKREVALSLYYHQLKAHLLQRDKHVKSEPMMLVGPTGTGKTFLVQKACELLHLDFVHIDASSLVSEGIVGNSISDIARDIFERAAYDLFRAQECVVFLDEFDKLFCDEEGADQSVVHQLLRFIEGASISFNFKDDQGVTQSGSLQTQGMQFILAGAFQWLYEKKEQRIEMGFQKSCEMTSKERTLVLEDFYEAGVSKEILGRLTTVVNLQVLDEEDYYKLLTQSQSSPLKSYISKVRLHHSEVDIDDQTIREIAKRAADSQLGVRALKQILQMLFKEALFHAPQQKQRYKIRF